MSAPNRLPTGGRIDRSRTLRFLFNGTRLEGHPGDTLASALVANGLGMLGRSLKYHRPRGLMTAGWEEPNALFQVGFGPRATPNLKATEIELYDGLVAVPLNGWPSMDFDIGVLGNAFPGLLAAGFPYKTFKGPGVFWHRLFEPLLRRAAGWGKLPDDADRDRYETRWEHCDILVVGAGPAGLAAALAASAGGARVVLADSQSEPGGSLLHRPRGIDGRDAEDWVREASETLAARPEVRLLPRTTVAMLKPDGWALAVERRTDHLGPQIGSMVPRQRLWRIRARRVIVATGAVERPLVFAGNDRPRIMLADAVMAYVRRWAALPGRNAIVFTNNDTAYETANTLLDVGAGVAAFVDVRPDPPAALVDRLRSRDVEVLTGHAIVATGGRRQVTSARIMPLTDDGRGVRGKARTIQCGLLAVSGGWTPEYNLFAQAGGRLAWDETWACPVPDGETDVVVPVGGCAGVFDLGEGIRTGYDAGAGAAAATGFSAERPPTPSVNAPEFGPPRALWAVPSVRSHGWARQKAFVDFQNDTTVADIRLAVREGFEHPEHVKRYALVGLGTDQGRIGNVNALGILADAVDRPVSDLAPTTARPPAAPMAFGTIAGRSVGPLAAPERLTPIHDWQFAAGARFGEQGGWRRPRCYPLPGEAAQRAVEREVRAVREKVGLHDASPYGKIDVQGPDAAVFLDRVYTNTWSSLPEGRLRYGLILTEEGTILDDGIGARLGEHRYHLTTNAGSVRTVLEHLEWCRQVLWPELRVFVTPVTEQWATVALTGPRSRDVLGRLAPDLSIGTRDFPFMAIREAAVGGITARVARISFTGELSYEVSVPWSYGMTLWQAALEAGAPFGIVPVGLDAMAVLRAEKGFIVVGQDTDSTTTPHDLGYERLVDMDKPVFVGRTGLERPVVQAPGRRQLVGLLTEDPRVVLPEGAALAAERTVTPPVEDVGHVTSSYFSPTLGRFIALALVKDGRRRTGEKVHAPLEGRTVTALVADPVFFDPEGRRRDG